MTEYLVEAYVSKLDEAGLADVVARTRAAVDELAAKGVALRHLHSVFVPADETCFHSFDASSAEAVREAAERAALGAERIVEAIHRGEGELL